MSLDGEPSHSRCPHAGHLSLDGKPSHSRCPHTGHLSLDGKPSHSRCPHTPPPNQSDERSCPAEQSGLVLGETIRTFDEPHRQRTW